MSYIEANFISRQEYKASEASRVSEATLVVNELYVAMFAIAANKAKVEAATLPLRIQAIEHVGSGACRATVAILDRDLQTSLECPASFSDGYWVDASKQIVIKSEKKKLTKKSLPVTQSYIKPYRTELDDALQDLVASLSLPSQELVTA